MIQFVRENSRGIETTHTLPSRRAICDRCDGYGTHLTPSIGQHAYSAEEFADAFDDDERGEYFRRGGIYDVACEACRGAKVVDEVDDDEAAKTSRGRRTLLLWYAKLDAEASWRAEEASQRRYGY